MPTLGLPASGRSPHAAAVAGAGRSVENHPRGDWSPVRPPLKTHQTHTLGKRSREQLDLRLDSAAAGLPPPTARDGEPLETLMPAAELGRARLPPESYRNWEDGEESIGTSSIWYHESPDGARRGVYSSMTQIAIH
jgi:hypothetical protein